MSSDEASSPLNPDGKNRFYSDALLTKGKSRGRSLTNCSKLLIACILLLLLLLLVIVLVAVFVVVLHKVVAEEVAEPWKSKRLPSSAKPETYDITLNVDLDTLTVTGEESINVKVVENTQWILLQYSESMNITSVDVLDSGKSQEGVSNELHPDNEYVAISKEGDFNKNKVYTVVVKFSYYLYSGGLSGFYNSTYNEDGEAVVLATTQFEPIYARKAFPCFDEPAMKANFTITIVHPNTTIALSNMPILAMHNDEDGVITTHFAPSVPMSTYLVAFIVCEFKFTTSLTNASVNVSVYARPSLVNDTKYSLDIAVQVLEYYEQFFGINYPLIKMDLVAIPDFNAGAMENWGLVTYRETALLVTENVSSSADKQWVTEVVAHELAHQWFGNLVTMAWWQDLWLNEGFATYISYLGTNICHPEWNYLDFFIIGDLHVALEADGFNETHPIIQSAETLSEINGFMGMEEFRLGLNHYLNKHKYGNAKSADLWSALQGVVENVPYNITAVMDTWTIQGGYPILTVTLTDGCAKLKVTQERFVIVPTDPKDFAKSEFNYIWKVPINFITDSNPDPSETFWLNKKEDEFTRTSLSKDCKWLKANFGELGFYRVNYEDAQWTALTDLLNTDHTQLQTADRANLLDDAVSLSIAGFITPMQALDLVSYLKQETDYIALRVGLLSLSQIHTKVILSKVEGSFTDYVLCLLETEIEEAVGTFPNATTGHLENLKRSLILKYALLYGNTTFAGLALDEFESFMAGTKEPVPDLKDVILTAGIREGGQAEWEFLWNKYVESDNPTEQSAILSALSYTKEPWLIQLYLDRSLTEVRSQDGLTVLRRLASNSYAWPYLWNFFKENYDELFNRYGSSLSFGRAITAATGHFTTQNQLDELEMFFSNRDAGSGIVALKSGIEQIKSNINWLDKNLDNIDNWLHEFLLANCNKM
ncbi:Glutamyl aminopeptidase-like [Oopsacas minuta]|uniref:Aminopeptidase n=1 Tax=Oopsacas minuta TaxID=111878 RepID=A0AAV7JT70_9METZ|nr:Glutamyl aminopeptidase-like [Oopsacas minuta]